MPDRDDTRLTLEGAVRDFVDGVYRDYRIAELLRMDPRSARNAVDVAFEELKARLCTHRIPIGGREDLRARVHAHVGLEHRFLFDDIIDWDAEIDDLARPDWDGSGLIAGDWDRLGRIEDGRPPIPRSGFSLEETADALDALEIPRGTRGLTPAAGEKGDLIPREEVSQPHKIWERIMGCRDLPPPEYKVRVRSILKAWKNSWDEEDKDGMEFQRHVYSMLRTSAEYVDGLRENRDDPIDHNLLRASHLYSALQIFSANIAEDLARQGRLGKATFSARSD